MQTYPTGYAESHRIAEQIFREILPRHSMAVREEQIALCHEVLDTLYNKEISLCEAGVGTGKTLAYLVGCILWQMHRPERMKLPIVISTSSVALQDAILTEYLPELSDVLLDEGIITAPTTAVVRKGKERFVCDARLAERASLVHPKRTREKSRLRIAENILDMDRIPELSRYDRCRICVPQSCPRDCFMRLDCRYQQYLRDSMKPDIQICNHNYLLADASHRLEDRPLLLRSYQALVVDEAHKLPDAARQMYTETLSPHNMDELCLLLQQAHYKDFARQLRTAFLTLSFSCTQGLSKLRGKASEPFVLTPFRRAALIDCIALLQNACRLPDVPRYLLNRLGEAESLLRLFLLEVPTRILYIDYDADGQPTFCAASSRVPQLLRSALWNTREPAILTSGTLAAAGDFSHTEQLLGLAAYRPLRHFRANSPFNYKKKMSVILSASRKNANGQPQNGRRNRSVGWCLPRSRAGVVHSVPPDGRSPRADGRSVDIPDLSGVAQRRQNYPAVQRIRKRHSVRGWFLLGGYRLSRQYGVTADYRKAAVPDSRPGQRLRTPTVPESARLHKRQSHPRNAEEAAAGFWSCHSHGTGFLCGSHSG